jgi:dienelactone hydrolase
LWNALGARLAELGITALAIDYRGYGESGDTPHDKLTSAELAKVQTEKWPSDIDSAFASLARQPGVNTSRMGAGGGSCGVDNAVQLALRHRNVRALTLLAGGTGRAGRQFLASASAPPIFTAAAADDQYANFVEIMGWHAALSKSTRSRMAQYEDGGHAAVIFAKHPGLADTIATWFGVVLGTQRGVLPKTNGVAMRAELARVLGEIDRPGGAVAVGKRLARERTKHPGAQLFPEYFPNLLGYEHMQRRELRTALEIMQLNVAAYPASPNAMDSLGDVYLEMGNKAAALETARKTLVLLKTDTSDSEARKQGIRDAAEAKLKQLSPRQSR